MLIPVALFLIVLLVCIIHLVSSRVPHRALTNSVFEWKEPFDKSVGWLILQELTALLHKKVAVCLEAATLMVICMGLYLRFPILGKGVLLQACASLLLYLAFRRLGELWLIQPFLSWLKFRNEHDPPRKTVLHRLCSADRANAKRLFQVIKV
jgi:hypothetical protein